MKGKVYIIDKQNSIGKIIFENQESAIVSFPKTFENGDDVEVLFQNNNISEKPLKMVAYNDSCYGFIIGKFSNEKGNILTTYPQMLGLINYKTTLPLNRFEKVTFKIKKTLDGKLEAIDIQEIEAKESYKAKLPLFGKLKRTTQEIKESFVSDVVKTKPITQELSSGVVKFTKGYFGFISVDGKNQDAYFNLQQYEKFYKKKPTQGDAVYFFLLKTTKGVQVKSFCHPKNEEFLPKKEQYAIVDNHKFSLNNFEAFYKREPAVGDVIYYILEDGNIKFKKDKVAIERISFVQKEASTQNIITSKIVTLKDKFGFIKAEQNIYFKIDQFKKVYNRKPEVGDVVKFSINCTQRGQNVAKFISNSDISVSEKRFKNFVHIDANALYYLYEEDHQAKEVYKFNPNLLSEAIACYKDKDVKKKFKLLAINTLIQSKYQDKKINPTLLETERIRILNTFIDASIKQNNFQRALEYESLLQQIVYKPSRLARVGRLIPKQYHIEDNDSTMEIKITKNSEKLNIIEKAEKVEPIKHQDYFDIDVSHRDVVRRRDKESWNIDLVSLKELNHLMQNKRWNIIRSNHG